MDVGNTYLGRFSLVAIPTQVRVPETNMARRLVKLHLRREVMVRWIYPPLDEAMTEVGLEEVETYVLHRQNTVAHYIAT